MPHMPSLSLNVKNVMPVVCVVRQVHPHSLHDYTDRLPCGLGQYTDQIVDKEEDNEIGILVALASPVDSIPKLAASFHSSFCLCSLPDLQVPGTSVSTSHTSHSTYVCPTVSSPSILLILLHICVNNPFEVIKNYSTMMSLLMLPNLNCCKRGTQLTL